MQPGTGQVQEKDQPAGQENGMSVEYTLEHFDKLYLRRLAVIIISTIVGIILFVGGCVGVVLTWLNYQVSSLTWIEGLLTYGMFAVLGLGIIVFIVMTPRET